MEYIVAATTKGRVKGYIEDGICTFKGIPYAKAKRFHAPEEADPWEDVWDATSYGYVCPLMKLPKPNGEILIAHRYWPMNENCLNLNIWTPGCDGKKRPVVFWLHGGGFEEGSSIEQLVYEGGSMSKGGDVVVVSINHRLNLLGFFDLSAFGEEYKNSGNAGLEDIVAALLWVRKNIASFGGDPENVTIIGQSGGGAKVTCLLQTPAADGLYAKAVNMSGIVPNLLPDRKGSGKELAAALMAELQISSVEELETVSWHSLFEAYQKVKPELEKQRKNIGCCPFKNEYYLGEPVENGFRKETSQIPLLVGSCFAEFSGFLPLKYDRVLSEEEGKKILEQELGEKALQELLPLFHAAYPERPAVDLMLMDMIFRIPGQQYIRERSKGNNCTYSYLFNVDFPIDGGRPAWHCSDIPFFFNNTDLMALTRGDAYMKQMEQKIFAMFMQFVHTGNPNHPDIPRWEPSTAAEEKCLVFGSTTEVRINHDAELMPKFREIMGPILMRQMAENMEKVQH